MGRPAKFTETELLDVAAKLLVAKGPAGLSLSAVAEEAKAPSGSVYHRFPSRDFLGAALWLRSVERFHQAWLEAMEPQGGDDEVEDVVRRSAAFVLEWCRANLTDARVLLLYRSEDLFSGEWPQELRERNERQLAENTRRVTDLAKRLGRTSKADVRRLRFALIDIPYGAVRSPLSRGRAPSTALDQLVDDAVVAVLAPLL